MLMRSRSGAKPPGSTSGWGGSGRRPRPRRPAPSASSARRRLPDAFVEANRERIGALIGSSDCHFGTHDIAQVVTVFAGDFRAAIMERKTTPRRGPGKLSVPTGMFWRQQWRALVDLPIRRLRGEL